MKNLFMKILTAAFFLIAQTLSSHAYAGSITDAYLQTQEKAKAPVPQPNCANLQVLQSHVAKHFNVNPQAVDASTSFGLLDNSSGMVTIVYLKSKNRLCSQLVYAHINEMKDLIFLSCGAVSIDPKDRQCL